MRDIVTQLGRMSLETAFGDRHSVDIGPCVKKRASIQGILLEIAATTEIDGEDFAIYRVIGITRAELEYKQKHGSEALLAKLKVKGIYPNTIVKRASVV